MQRFRPYLVVAIAALLAGVALPCRTTADEEPADVKAPPEYERAIALWKGATAIKDAAMRERQLEKARVLLKEFIADQPTHALVTTAGTELASLLAQRAAMRVEKAKKPLAEPQRGALHKEARELYEEAHKVLTGTQAELRARLIALPVPPPNPAQRDQWRADYLQVQLFAAAVREETADTEIRGTEPHRAKLLAAADDFKEIFEKYRTRLAGLYARMYQARCYLKLEKNERALECLEDLLEQPDQPQEFRTLKVKVLNLAAECCLGTMPKNNYGVAIKHIVPFFDMIRADERRMPALLELQLWLGKAHLAEAEYLAAHEPERMAERQRSFARARELIRFVAKNPSDVQAQAVELLERCFAEPMPEPRDFAAAKTAGKKTLEAMQLAAFNAEELARQMVGEKDANVKTALEVKLEQARKDADSTRADALKHYSLALRLAGPEHSEDVAVVLYFLSYLYYSQGDNHEAAVLAEQVARRYPDSAGARQCAKIALAANLRIHKEGQSADKSFEARKIKDIAGYIVSKWPKEPEAIEAINTLIPFLIKEGKLDESESYLARIPEEGAARGEAELKVGQALWSKYLRGLAENPKPAPEVKGVVVELAPTNALVELRQHAQRVLVNGVQHVKVNSGSASPEVAAGVLSLAQIYVDSGQPGKAIEALEDEKFGTLKLVLRKDPAAATEGLGFETLKTALRAYLRSLATVKPAEADGMVVKVENTLKALKDVGGTAAPGHGEALARPPDPANRAAVQETARGDRRAFAVALSAELRAWMKDATPEARQSLSRADTLIEKFIRENDK